MTDTESMRLLITKYAVQRTIKNFQIFSALILKFEFITLTITILKTSCSFKIGVILIITIEKKYNCFKNFTFDHKSLLYKKKILTKFTI